MTLKEPLDTHAPVPGRVRLSAEEIFASELAAKYVGNSRTISGASHDALVKTSFARAMEDGSIVRLEEPARMGSEVQDILIAVPAERTMLI